MKKMIIVGAVLVASPGFAQTAPRSNDSRANETICRTVKDTGSRLARTRVCMTRAEWEQHRRETRANVDRAQMQRVEPATQ